MYKDVVPQYAIHWEDFGIKLGLEKHHIDTISHNNAYNPNRTVDCCKSMLKKWLEMDYSATRDKLRNAIRTITKGESMASVYVSTTYIYLHSYFLLRITYSLEVGSILVLNQYEGILFPPVSISS